jgi:hypothetical protein
MSDCRDVVQGPSAEEVAYVSAVFNALADALVRFGRPMPATVARARQIFDSALTFAMSLERHNIGSDSAELDEENIGSDEVAKILGVTRRTVQRNAEVLGARRVSGAYVFNRNDLGAIDG